MADTYDLVIKNAKLPDSGGLVDISIKGNKIIKVEKGIKANAKRKLDVKGNLTSPGFIDAHMHLDHALTGGDEIWNGRTLAGAIKASDDFMEGMTNAEITENAITTAKLALSNGTTALRTHVSANRITDVNHIKAVMAAKKACSKWMDMQVVVLINEMPLSSSKIGESLLRRTMAAGADIVGGLPYRDPEPDTFLDIIFDVARAYNAEIDLHVDETNDPKVLTLENFAEKTVEYGYQGKVAASHCCSISHADASTASRVISKVRDAKMSIIANPLTNLYLQGKDGHPNEVTRVREFLEAGVKVIYGTDNTLDPFNPLGMADMLSAALFLAYWKHLAVRDPLSKIFHMGTYGAAEITKLIPNYGIRAGGQADVVVFEAKTPAEAIMKQSKKLYVIKNGKLVVENGALKI